MLQNIRDKAQGWIAWAIVILITIPFALWGIQSYLGGGSEPVVASVNGKEITERSLDRSYQQYRQDLRQRLGESFQPEMFDDKRLREEVLHRMVRENLILQTSHDMGLRVGNETVHRMILGIDAFYKNGRFDQQTFERIVRMQGLSPAGFEERLRQDLLSQQLALAVEGSAFITEHELKETIRLVSQTRKVDYFIIPSKDFESDEPVADAEVQAYYDQHQEQFRSPEQVKLEYILLSTEVVGKTVKVDESALKDYYDTNQEKFGRPEERQASHILIKLDKDADQAQVAEATAKIDDLKRRLQQGEDFAELAKANSEDPGTAEAGGDLGYFGRGIMDPAFEKAVFSLREGEVSDPVRTPFGLHLIKLTGIKAGSVKPFDEARPEVEAAYRKAEGERLYFEMADKLANLSYEDPSSLEPAASELGLQITRTDWIDRNSVEGVLKSPKVLNAAFSDDVRVEHNNSELIELDQLKSIVLRVADYKEASIKPLKEVKEPILAAIKQQRAAAKVREEAEKRLQSVKEGSTLAQVAGDYKVKTEEALKRSAGAVPIPLQREIFRAPRPEQGQAVSEMVELNQGNVALFSLYEVKDGSLDEVNENLKPQIRESLRNRLSRRQYDSLLEDLQARADISYFLSDSKK